MSRMRWAKWFWDDWAGDNALSLCSLAAQGLWMRLLCIAAQGDDYGSITIGGVAPSDDDLAKLIRPHIDPRRFTRLLAELEAKKVVRRDEDGTLFSRRMRVESESNLSQSAKGKKSASLYGNQNLTGNPVATSVVTGDHTGRNQNQKQKQTPPRTPPQAGGARGRPRFRNGFCELALEIIEERNAEATGPRPSGARVVDFPRLVNGDLDDEGGGEGEARRVSAHAAD